MTESTRADAKSFHSVREMRQNPARVKHSPLCVLLCIRLLWWLKVSSFPDCLIPLKNCCQMSQTHPINSVCPKTAEDGSGRTRMFTSSVLERSATLHTRLRYSSSSPSDLSLWSMWVDGIMRPSCMAVTSLPFPDLRSPILKTIQCRFTHNGA